MIPHDVLEEKVGELLDTLYEKRFAALQRLTLSTLLQKNPYLYRALGASRAQDFVEQLLIARISSSDETIFGNDFFEPLARFAAEASQGGMARPGKVDVGAAAGQDIAISSATQYLAISVKSGKNIFNSQSTKGQLTEFGQLHARVLKEGKLFRAIIGYGYGRKGEPKKPSPIEKLAGQRFWELLTGEDDFYLRIARSMESFAKEHAEQFKLVLDKKQDSLLREFMIKFVHASGQIDWDAVVAFNSSALKPKRAPKPKLAQKFSKGRISE